MTKNLRLRPYLILNLIALILFIIDRWLKFYFLKNPVKIFGGDFIFSLHLEKNYGIAFGLLFNQLVLQILVVLILFSLFWILILAYRRNNFGEIFSLTLIIVGAGSNLLDRLRYGYVIDYFDLKWFTVFNFADVMISFGVLIILAISLGLDRKMKIS